MTDHPHILCLTCNMASYSAGDIENRFCPTCGYLDYCGDPYEIYHPLVNKQAEEMPVWAVYKHHRTAGPGRKPGSDKAA